MATRSAGNRRVAPRNCHKSLSVFADLDCVQSRRAVTLPFSCPLHARLSGSALTLPEDLAHFLGRLVGATATPCDPRSSVNPKVESPYRSGESSGRRRGFVVSPRVDHDDVRASSEIQFREDLRNTFSSAAKASSPVSRECDRPIERTIRTVRGSTAPRFARRQRFEIRDSRSHPALFFHRENNQCWTRVPMTTASKVPGTTKIKTLPQNTLGIPTSSRQTIGRPQNRASRARRSENLNCRPRLNETIGAALTPTW